MKRLINGLGKNSSSEYDRIFHERAKAEPNWQDVRRWKVLMKEYRGGLVLDLGCLDSRIPEFMNESDYWGVDVAEEALEKMRLKYPKARYLVRSIFMDSDMNGGLWWHEKFDYVILGEVLEHMENPSAVINIAFSTLKPGGILAISVPLEEAIEPGAVDGERHLWSFTKQDIIELVTEKTGFHDKINEPKFCDKFKFKVLRSQWFPKYKYCFPQLICWATKK